MEQRIKNYEETISTLINLNNKENIKNKLVLVNQLIKENIYPSKAVHMFKSHISNVPTLPTTPTIPTTDSSSKKEFRLAVTESKYSI